MKNLNLMLIAILCMTLTSCSWFVSRPIEPKILGISTLQHAPKGELWMAVIDSTQYTIAEITIPDKSLRSFDKKQYLRPVEGMPVTLFTAPRMQGVHAVLGEQSVEQIEELYRKNMTSGVIVLFIVAFCLIGAFLLPDKKQSII